MFYLTVDVLDERLSAKLVTHSPTLAARIRQALPATLSFVQEEWSGAFVTSTHGLVEPGYPYGPFSPYQQPGRMYLEPSTGRVSICYGQGRLQDAFQPLRVMALVDFLEPEDRLSSIWVRAQFDGALQATFAQTDTPPAAAEPVVPDVTLTLADTVAHVKLLTDVAPAAAKSMLSRLPLEGYATNTHSSGPLTRFWNPAGGVEGITPLDVPEGELAKAHTVLYGGHVYYLPKPTHAGFRITTRQAATMRSPVGGPGLKLVPMGKLVGEYQAFAALCEQLRMRGRAPMTIRPYAG